MPRLNTRRSSSSSTCRASHSKTGGRSQASQSIRASTQTAGVVGELGGFAGLYALDDERLLAATTDGVGTKLVLGRRAGRLRDAGADLAAHCINDVLTTGAEPLFLLDYVAANELDLEQVAELVEGAAEVCRAAGVALIGGETAELPGIYRDEELDFAGTCVGWVERERLEVRALARYQHADHSHVTPSPSSSLPITRSLPPTSPDGMTAQ